MRILAGMWAGAVLGALGAIGWNTSANTAVLEGARRHLTFHTFLVVVAIAAAVGFIVGLMASGRPNVPPPPPE